MTHLATWILSILLQHAPPGATAYSVTPTAECAGAEACPGSQWSEHYGTWVHRETAAEGAARYSELAEGLAEVVSEELPGDFRPAGSRGIPEQKWTAVELAAVALSVALFESGFREDVQVGRGSARKASQDGGRGRGRGDEACAVQAHPVSAWRYAEIDQELRDAAERNESGAREKVARTLLGREPAAVRACWRVAVRQLMHSRRWCAWKKTPGAWSRMTFALYGSGSSCTEANGLELRDEFFGLLMKRKTERWGTLVLGDSLAEGLGPILCSGKSDCVVSSHRGATAAQLIGKVAWALRFKRVVVSVGANDCRAPAALVDFERNVRALRLAGAVLLEPPGVCAEAREVIRAGAFVASPLGTRDLADGIHPDHAGYARWARAVLDSPELRAAP